MADRRESSFHLEAFVDSLIVELDNVQNRLAVKGLTRPLTYTVQDLNLDLQVFPDFDGRRVRFRPAKPGESGFSKISLQLGSITDRQIRETTRGPVTRDEEPLESIPDLDDDTKSELRAIGVNSVSDLEQVQRRNVDIGSVAKKGTDYATLANLINKARRRQKPPEVARASTASIGGRVAVAVEGKNLFVQGESPFPLARINGHAAAVQSADRERLVLVPTRPLGRDNRLEIALDPYAIVNLNVRSNED